MAVAVELFEGRSALQVLYRLLQDAVREFPDVFGNCPLTANEKAFRTDYPNFLPNFEAARLASPARIAIARSMVAGLGEQVVWQGSAGVRLLSELLSGLSQPLTLETRQFGGSVGWQPNLVYHGERWTPKRFSELGAKLVELGTATQEAGDALGWVSRELLATGQLDLAGRKIAVLGGGAEMAPTKFWLEAGADVLWLDTVPPPSEWFEDSDLSGSLSWSTEPADLLTKPNEIFATLLTFAGGHPLDVGLYAYAPGQARELRLTSVMNAIVTALPRDLVSSVTMLVSPTTPTGLSTRDVRVIDERLENRPAWQSVAHRVGAFGRGSSTAQVDGSHASKSVVGIQGASYQAAQYLGKTLTAEVWSQAGIEDGSWSMRVSANTAAITRTRSLAHPVFAAAFGGAAAFGVETLTPRQSRRLNGLLVVHDWMQPEHPVPGKVRLHGGIHTLPYPLEPALRLAAAIGFARSPRLLRGLLTRH